MKGYTLAATVLMAALEAAATSLATPHQYAVQMLTMNPTLFEFTEWYLVSTFADQQNLVLLLNPDDNAPNGGATPLEFTGPSSDFSITFHTATSGPSAAAVVGGLIAPGEHAALGINTRGAGTSEFSLGPYNITGYNQLLFKDTPGGGFYVCRTEIDNIDTGRVFFASDNSKLPISSGTVDLIVSKFDYTVV